MLFMNVFAQGAGEGGRRSRQLGSRRAQGPLQPGRGTSAIDSAMTARAGQARARAQEGTRTNVTSSTRRSIAAPTRSQARVRSDRNANGPTPRRRATEGTRN